MTIETNISLHNKNWFCTGGPAKFYCEPETEHDFASAVQFANHSSQDIFVLGEGANILISDEGFDGLVIRPRLKNITFDTNHVTAGAGVSLPDLINACLDHNLSGF